MENAAALATLFDARSVVAPSTVAIARRRLYDLSVVKRWGERGSAPFHRVEAQTQAHGKRGPRLPYVRAEAGVRAVAFGFPARRLRRE